MSEILLLGGTCGEGPGSYEAGVFHLPDGSARGVEDLADFMVSYGPEPASRRLGIARGLRDALASTGPLPRPLGLAASVAGFGLDVIGGGGRPGASLELRFADGAIASVRTEADAAARIVQDREVVRLALLRRAVSAPMVAETPTESAPTPEGSETRALASIFAYEKRGGRLRRVAAKALDTPDS
ncbi:hypothetical protein MKK58_13830 [Methylobacterium sp. J-078]|uniref:hypothetical protein n=1 Tax=Methylobacterium sp. J-078 TaxID=2836657 RepID=UPI001FB954D7|nr:hypothetical protein [Methylobacterium sp. J-078]MCJ2045603.1 hypothetical protein [Methylobacterium sp. J-078]